MVSLAVDKIKKKVTISLSDQSLLTGFIFLSRHSERGGRPETVMETLASGARFIPFESNEGEISFINVRHLVWLASLHEPELSEDGAPPIPMNVTVCLTDGKRLRGDMLMMMPVEKNRLSDRLNTLEHFLSLKDEKREVLINLDFVIRVA